MYLTELVSLLELLNFSLSKKCIRQPQGGICQNDSTSEAQSMNSNYLRYIWAFYRQRPLSGWVLCNIMCLYRLLLFPLCILITLAIFSPPNSYEQNFNYTYSWVRNAHPCFCEPCIRALKRRLGVTERQAGVCAGDGTGTHWHSWIREGSAASTDTICKGFTASKGCIVMRYTPQGVFHADLCGAGLRLQSRVVFPGCPPWDLMHEHWWEDDNVLRSSHSLSGQQASCSYYVKRKIIAKKSLWVPKSIMVRIQPLLPCITVSLFLHAFSRALCTTLE